MFKGKVVEVDIGTGGYNANANTSQIASNQLTQSLNTSYAFGTLQREGGSALYTPSPLPGTPTIVGGHDWFPNLDSTQRSIIIGSDKKIRRDTGTGGYATTLKTLSTDPNNTPVFVEGGREQAALPRKLFMYTGGNNVQVLSGDGTSTTDLANPPVDWATTKPLGGCIHRNRHWAFGGQNPHWIYGSDSLDHEDFGAPFTFSAVTNSITNPTVLTSVTVPALLKLGDNISGDGIPTGVTVDSFDAGAGTVTMSGAATASATITVTANNPDTINLPVYPGVGESIAAICSFKGMLIVFKYPRGIYYVDMTNPDITQWSTTQLSLEVGIAGSLAWCPVDDDIEFMDAQGSIHMLSAVLAFGDYGLQSVSDKAWMRNYVVNNEDLSKLPNLQAVFYLAKRETHFTMTAIGTTTNSDRLVVDFNNIQNLRFRYANKDALVSLWLARDNTGIPRIFGGDTKGQVWILDRDDKSINGMGYPSTFQTSDTDFSDIIPDLAASRKNFKFLEIVSEVSASQTLSVDVMLDGAYSQTVSFHLGVNSSTLGSFTLDTDALGIVATSSIRQRVVGSGKRIAIIGNMSAPGSDYSVSKLIVSFSIAGESDDH